MTKEQFLVILDSVSPAEHTAYVEHFRLKISHVHGSEISHALRELTEALKILVDSARTAEDSAAECRLLPERVSLANDMITVMTDAWMVQWEAMIREQFQHGGVSA
ncbi:MAG: hypothetical protein IKN55_11310 [Oscillospiraceae bacterium]|nr:hypothetical protein [Oscillospiraceae bacterium]